MEAITIKRGVNHVDIIRLKAGIGLILFLHKAYANQYGLPLTITSLADDAPGRVSDTHKDFRAYDASINGWPKIHQDGVCNFVNAICAKSIGTSPSGKDPKALIVHKTPEGVLHFHAQIRPGVTLDMISELFEQDKKGPVASMCFDQNEGNDGCSIC